MVYIMLRELRDMWVLQKIRLFLIRIDALRPHDGTEMRVNVAFGAV